MLVDTMLAHQSGGNAVYCIVVVAIIIAIKPIAVVDRRWDEQGRPDTVVTSSLRDVRLGKDTETGFEGLQASNAPSEVAQS